MSLPLNQVINGDCTEVMREWPENSVDCVVTDPPYGLSFMGKDWDKTLPPREAFDEIIRVLKPGALAFVMSSPRQDVLWRMLAMLEGVGFELRQSFISWIYKTGFPKAYDVSKGIDKTLGEERETVSSYKQSFGLSSERGWNKNKLSRKLTEIPITTPSSDLAKQWEGYKSQSGLKPALECILMVNKPRSEKTIVDNVLRWGTGAINVDACRIPFPQDESPEEFAKNFDDSRRTSPKFSGKYNQGKVGEYRETKPQIFKGRFPANLLVSDSALDDGKVTKSGKIEAHHKIAKSEEGHSVKNVYGKYKHLPAEYQVFYGDEGSPFRFFDLDAWAKHHGFLDVTKPSTAERDFGLNTQPLQVPKSKFNLSDGSKDMRFDGVIPTPRRNIHPTVKPMNLMAYLIELGCPPDGVVVDPFVGSGTTCIAAKQLRRKWIGIEINPEYAEIAEARINIRGPLDQFMEAEK